MISVGKHELKPAQGKDSFAVSSVGKHEIQLKPTEKGKIEEDKEQEYLSVSIKGLPTTVTQKQEEVYALDPDPAGYDKMCCLWKWCSWSCCLWKCCFRTKLHPHNSKYQLGEDQISLTEYRELERVAREIIRDESHLVDSRMSWFFAFQGLLLTAAAFAQEKVFGYVASGPGILGCLTTAFSVSQAMNAVYKMECMVERARKVLKLPYMNRFPIGGLDIRDKDIRHALFMPSRFMPIAMLGTWIALIIEVARRDIFENEQAVRVTLE